MVLKKAPLSLKEFMKSSLIVNYPCNRSSAKTAPYTVTRQDILDLCQRVTLTPKYGHVRASQNPDKARD